MIDGFNTGYLPLDTGELSGRLGVALNSHRVCHSYNGLIFGFVEMVDTDTGELRYMCKLRGSVHKYANRGAHNADAFRMSDLCRVFTELKEIYGVNPDITRLQNVEFGVNIKLSYDPRRVLNAVRTYKGKVFTRRDKIGIEYKTKEYRIKIYDKGRQCGVPGFENVLRIEVKAIVSYLKKQGVCVPLLGDLLNVDIWRQFEAFFLNVLDDTIIFEAIPKETLSKKERLLFTLFNGDGWQLLNRNVLYKRKTQFIELAERTGASSIKEELKRLVSEKCQGLRVMPTETGDIEEAFSTGRRVLKVNNRDKKPKRDEAKQATLRTFFEDGEKGRFGDIEEVKIKSRNVAYHQPESKLLPNDNNQPLCDMKKYNINLYECQCRGKPPDAIEFSGSG